MYQAKYVRYAWVRSLPNVPLPHFPRRKERRLGWRGQGPRRREDHNFRETVVLYGPVKVHVFGHGGRSRILRATCAHCFPRRVERKLEAVVGSPGGGDRSFPKSLEVAGKIDPCLDLPAGQVATRAGTEIDGVSE